MPIITPHVCRHVYCSIQARAGMYPKTLQYLIGHSDIGVTMNTYMYLCRKFRALILETKNPQMKSLEIQ